MGGKEGRGKERRKGEGRKGRKEVEKIDRDMMIDR